MKAEYIIRMSSSVIRTLLSHTLVLFSKMSIPLRDRKRWTLLFFAAFSEENSSEVWEWQKHTKLFHLNSKNNPADADAHKVGRSLLEYKTILKGYIIDNNESLQPCRSWSGGSNSSSIIKPIYACLQAN